MKKFFFLNLEYPKLMKGIGRFVASSKATNDITKIMSLKGFDYIPIIRHSTKGLIGNVEMIFQIYAKLLFRLNSNNVIFLQYPMMNVVSFLFCAWLIRSFKSIAIVHDLQTYRFDYLKSKRICEIKLLNSFKCIIVHTDSMKQKLKDDGVIVQIVVLESFDYLLEESQKIKEKKNTIVFAGALHKSLFLNDLHKLKFDFCSFNLYGSNLGDVILSDKIHYQGCFFPEEINMIEGEWGLLWDGNSVESCTGNFGRYLQLIAPHKFSLYISCGLKIIVWEKSAMANLVINEKLGITINSINEIENKIQKLSSIEINEMTSNVSKLSERIRKGEMFNIAFAKALSLLDK